MKKFIKTIACVGATIFVLWVAFSFLDIVNNNRYPNPQYSEYNILVND